MRPAYKAIDEDELQTEPIHMPQYERSYANLSKYNICGDTPETPALFKHKAKPENIKIPSFHQLNMPTSLAQKQTTKKPTKKIHKK